MEKKRTTIRMLAVLMAIVFVFSSATAVFAGGGDGKPAGVPVTIGPGHGSGTWTPSERFELAGNFSAVKLSLVVTSVDGKSRYNPALNEGESTIMQPLYSKINPISLSCDTKAFGDLEKEENLGCYGIGGCWIWNPEKSPIGKGATQGGKDIEGAVKRTGKGFNWTSSNNNLQDYRITEADIKKAYEATKKKKDFNGDKLKFYEAAGVSKASELYNAFLYNPENSNKILGKNADTFFKVGMSQIKTKEAAENPKNREKIIGNKAVMYTLVSAMKAAHGNEDAKLTKLFDKALNATLADNDDFRFLILVEIAAPLYGGTNNLYWLTTNSFMAACICENSDDFQNFPKRYAKYEKSTSIKANSTSGSGKGKPVLGGTDTDKDSNKGSTSRMLGLLHMEQELDDKCNRSLRVSRGINGAYQYWAGTPVGGAGQEKLNGRMYVKYAAGQSPSEKLPEIVGSRLSYTGPILTKSGKDGAETIRCMGFLTGKWQDSTEQRRDGEYEKYLWGWGCLSSEDAGIGASPVMQKAVVSSTNISLVSTVTEAGKEKLDVPNFNFSTLVPDGENSNGYKKLKSWATESLKSIKETGEVSKEVEDMLDEAVDWSTVKLPASDDEKVESKKFTKKQREEIKKRLSLLVTGLWKNNKTFATERNAELFMQLLLSLNSNSSTSSSSSGNSVSTDPSKGILLMSAAINRQKHGTNRFKATSFDTETKQPLTQTVLAEFNTSNVITAEKLNIDTDKVGEGLVLEGAQVTGNTDDINNFGYIADKTVEEQGGNPSKKYFAQPIIMYGCYLKLDPLILAHNKNWDSKNAKALGSIDFTNADSIKKSKVDKTEKSKNDYVSIPKGSIDLATAELQALITDFIADSKEYLNILKTSGADFKENETKAILSRELQIRILMWLDVIRDMRQGVEYRSYTRSDGSNSDRIWADTESFWNVKQENQTDGIAEYRDKFTNKGYSFGANPNSSKFESNKTKSSLGMVYCDFVPYGNMTREAVILDNFGRIKIRNQYAVLANYTGTGSNKPESVWVYLGDANNGKGKQTLLESFDMLDVGEDKLGGDLGIIRNSKDEKQYVNVGALSQYILSKTGADADKKSTEKSNSSSSKQSVHSGDDKDKKGDSSKKEDTKNKDANTEETEEEEDTIYDGSSAAEVGGMAAAIDFITWDTDGNDKTKTANSVIARMRAIGEATGSRKVVDAVLDGFGTSEAVQPKKMDLFDLIDVKLNSATKGLSYGGNEGTDKFNISIDSADVGRLIQVALYVSTFCKRETGIPITTESEKAYYWLPGCPYTICKSPWDGGIDSIKGSKNPEGQQADKSVVYRMNGDSEKFADKRISGYSGKNVELHEHTKDIDAITTITLNETFSSMMDIEEKVNKNETWLTDNMKGTYGHSGSILDLAIPVDIVTLFMDKDGNVIENMYEKDGTSGIPGMLSKYDLTNIERIKSGGREFKVEYQKEQSR